MSSEEQQTAAVRFENTSDRTTDTGARKLVPKTVVVTPPNQKSSFELKWTYGGRVLDQSGAARPGTFVNPVKGS